MRQGCSRSRQVTNTWTECSQVVCSTAFWFTFFSVRKKSQTVGKRYKFTRSSTDPDQSKCAIGVKMPLIIGQNSENPKPLFFFFLWQKNNQTFTHLDTLIPDQTHLVKHWSKQFCQTCVGDVEGMATPWLWIYNNRHSRTGAIRHEPDED